jgi:hypothetical protein
MDALQSLPAKTHMLREDEEMGGPSRIKRIVRENEDAELDDDYMKVRLYFY